ncbi:hypothetical protein [Azospirillum endophyticum]
MPALDRQGHVSGRTGGEQLAEGVRRGGLPETVTDPAQGDLARHAARRLDLLEVRWGQELLRQPFGDEDEILVFGNGIHRIAAHFAFSLPSGCRSFEWFCR